MAYSTPSPSDSHWSSSFSDCGTSVTSSSWPPHDLDLPVTPPMPFATISNLQKFSVTSAPQPRIMSPTSSPTSNNCTASAPKVRGRLYNRDAAEWERHRERIIMLYQGHTKHQKKTLKAVIAIMEEKHGFVATPRMYKSHLKSWGIRKNVTATVVHELMVKVEQYQERSSYMNDTRQTTEFDVGEDVDIARIQRYLKRGPVGVKNLRADPKRPLDVIKALSVDSGKARLGPAKVAISTAELDYQQTQPHFQMVSPSPDLMMSWSPGENNTAEDGQSDEMTRLIQSVIDQEFNIPYSFASSPLPLSPDTPSSTWQYIHPTHDQSLSSAIPPPIDNFQAPDELMLDFVLKFRIAHVLLDDGLTTQAFEVVNVCLNILSTRLQLTRSTDSLRSGTVILYALTAALEMATCFNHLDVLHMLFQHIDVIFAGLQPRVAEIARRMPRLGRIQKISMLKLARMMMSRAVIGYSGRENPGYEVYSRTVDIAISQKSSDEKLRELQVCLTHPLVQSSPHMAAWMEGRISLAVCDAPLANRQRDFWNNTSLTVGGFQIWSQRNKITAVLKYSSDRVDWHRLTGNWATANRWANDLAWLAEMVRGYDDEMSRKFRAEIESVKSPTMGQWMHADVESDVEITPVSARMGVSLSPMHVLHTSMSLPEIRGFKQETEHHMPTLIWNHHGHGQFDETMDPSLWNDATGAMNGIDGVSM